MTPNKRFLKEIRNLTLQQQSKELLENDYLVYFDEDDITKVQAIIKAPFDSVYRHKFVRLELKIGDDYPYSPPEVTFVNYDGVRIHPNMYENGKCCATILNTWGDNQFEKWTSSMGIETILLTFHSFLDNNPYTYEPGGTDDPTYTDYVLYQSWYTCLIRYLQYEKIDVFTAFMNNYLLQHLAEIFEYLSYLKDEYPLNTYYTRCFEVDHYVIDYNRVINTLAAMFSWIEYNDDYNENIPSENDQSNVGDYKCSICYDTHQDDDFTVLKCGHSFHAGCLESHFTTNFKLCPMCRGEVKNDESTSEQAEEWIVNPLTKRKIKVGGKTYIYLKNTGVL